MPTNIVDQRAVRAYFDVCHADLRVAHIHVQLDCRVLETLLDRVLIVCATNVMIAVETTIERNGTQQSFCCNARENTYCKRASGVCIVLT
jgi:hypothetical protein